MVWMRGEVYEALREIGVSEEKAIKAAVALYRCDVNDIDPNTTAAGIAFNHVLERRTRSSTISSATLPS